jgi:uncharacterized RDD family membrane protein YckC
MNSAGRLFRAPFTLTGRAAEAAWNETLDHGVLERAVAEAVRLGTLDRLVDELIAAGLLDRLVDALVERGLVDRVVEAAVGRGLIDRVVDGMLESGTVARIASSPDVQAVIPSGASLADDLLRALRRGAARADDSAGRLVTRLVRRRRTATTFTRTGNAGLVSRLIALIIDALVIVAVGLAVSGAAAVVVTLFGHVDVANVIGIVTAAVTSTVAMVAYFTLSWALVGQTLGMRALGLQVVGRDGRPPSIARALLLLLATALSIALAFTGYLLILWEPRRLALQDRLARTHVLYVTVGD